MRGFKLIAFSLIFLSFLGCARTDMLIGEGQHFPKRPKFSIKPNGDYQNTSLDFNAIYYNRWEINRSMTGEDIHVYYNYYRFWPNGRVLVNDGGGQMPSRNKAEDFTNAIVGYYQISGKNLVMEFFVPDSGVMNWDYERVFSVVEKDRIINIRAEIRNQKNELNEEFLKLNLGELTRQPNW